MRCNNACGGRTTHYDCTNRRRFVQSHSFFYRKSNNAQITSEHPSYVTRLREGSTSAGNCHGMEMWWWPTHNQPAVALSEPRGSDVSQTAMLLLALTLIVSTQGKSRHVTPCRMVVLLFGLINSSLPPLSYPQPS